MKIKIFRILVLIASILPAMLAFGMTWIAMWEGSYMALIFGSAVAIYCEYVYNTVKLFKGDV